MDGEGIVQIGGALREQDFIADAHLGRPHRVRGKQALVVRFGPRPFDEDGSVDIVRVRGFDVQPIVARNRPRHVNIERMDTRCVLHAVNLRDNVRLVGGHDAAHTFHLGNLIDLIVGETER